MERPAWAPRGIDMTVPSVSRMYDYYLGGSHNFEVDRQAARKAMEFIPGLPKIMQANRAFLRRAVRHAAGEGIGQFLDVGSGIPTFGNVHEVARGAMPGARVAYVDHDPVAVAHGQAMLADRDDADAVAGDLREPAGIRSHPAVRRLIDFDRPVAVLLVAVLHFVTDADDPWAAVAELCAGLARGSLLVISHASYEGIPVPAERARGTVDVYEEIRSPLVMRDRADIERFFRGFPMVEPGLVPTARWRPDGDPEDEDPYAFSGFAGVGRAE